MTEKSYPPGKGAEDFLVEAEDILDQMGNDLMLLGDMADRDECDPETVNSIFRGAHSLKGLAGMFGHGDISDFAHSLESLLDCLRLGKIPLDSQSISILFEAVEVLGDQVRSLEAGDADADADARVRARIGECIAAAGQGIAEKSLAALWIPEKILNALTEYEEHRLRENISRGRNIFLCRACYSLDTFDRDLGELTALLKESGEVISTLPSAEGELGSHIAFDILLGTELLPGELPLPPDPEHISIEILGGDQSREDRLLSPPKVSAGADEGREIPPVTEGYAGSRTARGMSRSMRVDIGKLDDLMSIVAELVLSHGDISAISDKMRNQGFSSLAIELGKTAKLMERKLNELQGRVMDIRMVPVGRLFERVSRIVRKICRDQGKKIELRLFGVDTELDKMIVEDIADPLMHIIRNSIDHGIEPPEVRRANGKDEQGVIRLSSYQKGNRVVIEVEDDGRGFDIDRIVSKAVSLGLIGSGDDVSSDEALELIFLPGFSTADQVSDLSGRGVGMDVVKNNIAAVSGTVEIESRPGLGSRVIITLPITLAVIKALLVRSGSSTYAVPITLVLETLSLDDMDIHTVERKEVVRLRESTLPLLRLEDFFEMSPPVPEPNLYAVVVGESDRKIGIIVDDLLGQRDIVIKSLGDIFKGVGGIAGAADLGDQRTILVLDISGIVAEATN
jgi:two-component system, chemotaxis family, sensor kinase CheA